MAGVVQFAFASQVGATAGLAYVQQIRDPPAVLSWLVTVTVACCRYGVAVGAEMAGAVAEPAPEMTTPVGPPDAHTVVGLAFWQAMTESVCPARTPA